MTDKVLGLKVADKVLSRRRAAIGVLDYRSYGVMEGGRDIFFTFHSLPQVTVPFRTATVAGSE